MNGVWTCEIRTPHPAYNSVAISIGPIGEFVDAFGEIGVDNISARFDELGIMKSGWFKATWSERIKFYKGEFLVVTLDSNPGKWWIGPARELLEH